MSTEIVITGLSGRFPECAHVEELRDKLFGGVDLVTEDSRRWPIGFHGLPKRNGKLKDLSRFDAMFFGVNPKQAAAMDPGLRILLESTYETIIDAGYNPDELRGKKIGVYIGQAFGEAMDNLARDPETLTGYGMSGCQRGMMANRISFTFDFKGPSYTVDTACSSSLYAFDHAVLELQQGKVEAALVGGQNLLLSPTTSLYFHRLNMLSENGMCRAFDASGKGYVRSEGVGTVFLQRRPDARRLYATVIGTSTNSDGYKEKGISFPSGLSQKAMIEDLLRQTQLKPSAISYIEAHGTGTMAGDPEEVNTIEAVFCKNPRENRLLIGSVKSNLGHAEATAGIVQLAKVILAMETGSIPGNLHFSKPNPNIPGLNNGNLQVVHENTDWSGGYAAINSFGFGGANAHVVLKSHTKPKKPITERRLPVLMTCSATTEDGVKSMLNRAHTYKDDDEFQALLHTAFRRNISGHTCRGFSILGKTDAEIEIEVVKREVWFVFSGMGTQWIGMARGLTAFDTFAQGLEKCARALKTVGVDLMDILNSDDESTLNVINSFICITSIQVGLVDLLNALGVKYDGLIGHSAGEIVCGYVDGSLTAEQAVLSSYIRGKSVIESKLPLGAMAAVAGLTWDQVKEKLPVDVFAACHNATDSVTISSSAASMNKLVAQFASEGITVREVNSSGCAFHSEHIAPAAPKLREALTKVIPNPKPRSSKWISTCVPESQWNEPWAKMSSADYHTHNLVSPVLFKEAVQKIPSGSLIVEIAPHALLSGLLRKSVSESVVVSLTKKGHPDPALYLLSSLGKIYNAGVALTLTSLYPTVEFPVGRGTPMIAPAITWDHSIEWPVPYDEQIVGGSSGTIKEVNISNDEDSFYSGHVIDGRTIFPGAGYLMLVWKAFAKKSGKFYENCPVVIEDVKFHKAIILAKDAPIKLAVTIFDGSNQFELTQGDTIVVSGKIGKFKDNRDFSELKPGISLLNSPCLTENDFYKDLHLRGYEYDGDFRGFKSSDINGLQGNLKWAGNWVTFMDAMLQFDVYAIRTRHLYLPTRISKVLIDPQRHAQLCDKKTEIPISRNGNLRRTQCGGVEIHNVKFTHIGRRSDQQKPILEEHVFVPYYQGKMPSKDNALTAALQVIQENLRSAVNISIMEIGNSTNLLHSSVIEVMRNQPSVVADVTVAAMTPEINESMKSEGINILKMPNLVSALDGNYDLVMGVNLLSDEETLEKIVSKLSNNCFFLCDEVTGLIGIQHKALELIFKCDYGEGTLLLYRKVRDWVIPDVINVTVTNFGWVKDVQQWLVDNRGSNKKLLITSRGEPDSGILGFIKCLLLEDRSVSIRALMLPDVANDGFSLDPYISQLKKDLTVNILRGHVWGSMYHLPIEKYSRLRTLSENAFVNTLSLGDLSSLKWIQGPHPRGKKFGDKVLCSVYYAPLNFRDIMVATGKLPPDALPGNLTDQECILGLEFAGRDNTGKRVMGIVEASGLATSVAADKGFLWEVPQSWTLEEASSVPIAYSTAYYALIVRGRLQKGEAVLIHAGTGGVGLAAITIALDMGCRVFTTVGSLQKRTFLIENFPQLTEEMIGNSRDSTFEETVLEQTDGKGVDIVLNSLAGELLLSSIRCLAHHGRFLEIGKVDLSENSPLGMSVFLKNTTVHGILLDALFSADENHTEKKNVAELMRYGIQSGQVRPLPVTVFQSDQIEQSFRYMATGKHIGKVVLKIREEEPLCIVAPKPLLIPAVPKFYPNPEKIHVLVGGLGGFGLELADWLICRGAQNLVLTCRSGVTTGYQALRLKRWHDCGVTVRVFTTNCQSLDGAMNLIKEASSLGPIGGIYNLAGVIQDALFINQTEESFEEVSMAKMVGTRNLDLSSRALCPSLEQFVVFSSVSCGRGNVGQTNYGFANSVMERICEARAETGLPALAIQWGAIGDVGMAVNQLSGHNITKVAGTIPQKIASCLASLDVLLTSGSTIVSSSVLADKGTSPVADFEQPNIVAAVANILGIKNIKAAGSTTLGELGIDSLMGTEIKQSLEINYNIILSPQDIRNLTFSKLEQLGVNSK